MAGFQFSSKLDNFQPFQKFRGKLLFKILSLDGGGIRGAFTAACLAELERELNRKLKVDKSIVEYFDLIAGTSTGGIIAVALAMGLKASEIESLYKSDGEKIFSKYEAERSIFGNALALPANRFLRRWGLSVEAIQSPLYTSHYLKKALELKLQSRILGEAKRRLIVPAVDLTNGQTIVFKTPHLPGMIRDRHYKAVDIILATTAAPTYFPHHSFGEPNRESPAEREFVDGGLWANNPSMAALVEAVRISRECIRDVDPKFELNDVRLLSIGTGTGAYSISPPKSGAGLGWWASRLIDTIWSSQSQGVDFQTKHMLGQQYKRVDFQIPGGAWKLDSTEHLPKLLGIGVAKAQERFAELERIFFSQSSLPFEPFP